MEARQSLMLDEDNAVVQSTAYKIETSPCTEPTQMEEKLCYIGNWEEADTFMRDNEYVKRGYRINFTSFKRILKSLFMCHNESTNVWSHLCGALLFVMFIVYIVAWIVPDDVLRSYKWQVIPGDQPSSLQNSPYRSRNSNSATISVYARPLNGTESSTYITGIVSALAKYVDSITYILVNMM